MVEIPKISSDDAQEDVHAGLNEEVEKTHEMVVTEEVDQEMGFEREVQQEVVTSQPLPEEVDGVEREELEEEVNRSTEDNVTEKTHDAVEEVGEHLNEHIDEVMEQHDMDADERQDEKLEEEAKSMSSGDDQGHEADLRVDVAKEVIGDMEDDAIGHTGEGTEKDVDMEIAIPTTNTVLREIHEDASAVGENEEKEEDKETKEDAEEEMTPDAEDDAQEDEIIHPSTGTGEEPTMDAEVASVDAKLSSDTESMGTVGPAATSDS